MSSLNRRKFFKLATASSICAAFSPLGIKNIQAQDTKTPPQKPATNIEDAKKHPRTENSMPGKYPAKVVSIIDENSVIDNKIVYDNAYQMLEKVLQELTGKTKTSEAWKVFVSDKDRIGLKVNPVAGKLLSTSIELVKAVCDQLQKAGIPKKNIIIWDRREMQLAEVGFSKDNFPGIKIRGTEQQDAEGSFYDKDGILYGEKMIDKEWYYWADCEETYDSYTLPYMINEGKYSYFSKICTQEIDKIINIPILKNAGPSVTLCMKNLAYGAISNTSRLHKQLWSDTCAEVCAFPPLRDKLVLNIVDGLRGCFNGGPSANPQFITNYNTIIAGSDPVAVDRIGYEIVLKKRIEEGLQEEDIPKARTFMDMADELGLGESKLANINHSHFDLKS